MWKLLSTITERFPVPTNVKAGVGIIFIEDSFSNLQEFLDLSML